MGAKRRATLLTLLCAVGLLGLPNAGADSNRDGAMARSPITSDLDLYDDFATFHGDAGGHVGTWLQATLAATPVGVETTEIASPTDVDRRRERRVLVRQTSRIRSRIELAERRFRRLLAGATGLTSAARTCRVLVLADDYARQRRHIQRATRSLLLSGRLQQRLDRAVDRGDTAEASQLRTALRTVERAWRIQRRRVVRLDAAISDAFRVLSDCLADAAGICGAEPVPVGRNLVANPGAENQPGASSSTNAPQPAAWRVPSGREPGVIVYGTGGFPEAPPGGGANFFMGGANANASMSQRFDVCRLADQIDEEIVVVELSALIGGYASQSDSARVILSFVDDAGRTTGFATLGPVTPADRDNISTLLERSSRILLPTGTRELVLRVRFERASGISNDGYVDNISLAVGLAARAG